MGNSERLKYLLYRCNNCHRILTKYQIIAVWEAQEAGGQYSKGVCSCGGGKISPSNATLWEELTTPAIWALWWKDVVMPKLGL